MYYKWCASDLLPKISAVSREIIAIRAGRANRADELSYIVAAKRQLMARIGMNIRDVTKTLATYDSFYSDLVTHGQPKSFREFLLCAPHMFTELGEKMGALGHITSFWRYQFPKKTIAAVDAEHLALIFHDFMVGVGASTDANAQDSQPLEGYESRGP